MSSNTYGRQVIVPLTNKSGGGVIAGDVVVVDTTNNDSFTTSTAGAFLGMVGIAQETIASNAVGRVLTAGYAALVLTSASVTRGNFGKTHTVAKQAVDAGATRVVGTFCQFLTGGTTPDAVLFGLADASSATGNVATDVIWDAAGDLAVGTGANTAARLASGAIGTVLTGVAVGTAPTWQSRTPTVLLDFPLASDISNQALTAGTAFDIIANQNFTVVSAGSLIEIIVRGYCFCNDAASNAYHIKVVIDSAGTPITKYIGGASNTSVVANTRQNPFGGGANFYVSGLSAATHTVKVQITATSANDHLYCRASTGGPPTNGNEFANVQVIEHL